MKKIIVAFDIDGTLRNNEEAYGVADMGGKFVWNDSICEMAYIMSRMKNVEVIIWSGGGRKYAESVMEKYHREKYERVFRGAFSKVEAERLNVDLAVDDIHACELGKLNMIVREK